MAYRAVPGREIMGRLPRGKRGHSRFTRESIAYRAVSIIAYLPPGVKKRGGFFPRRYPTRFLQNPGPFHRVQIKRGKASGRGTDTGAAPAKDRPESPSAAARLWKGIAVCEVSAGHWSYAVGKRFPGKSDKKAANSGLSPPPSLWKRRWVLFCAESSDAARMS